MEAEANIYHVHYNKRSKTELNPLMLWFISNSRLILKTSRKLCVFYLQPLAAQLAPLTHLHLNEYALYECFTYSLSHTKSCYIFHIHNY